MSRKGGDHFVYDLKDGAAVLYVGCSCNPKRRFAGHVATKRFPAGVRMVIVKSFDNWADAVRFEAARIVRLQPPMNSFYAEHGTGRLRTRGAMDRAEAKQIWTALSNREKTHRDVVAMMPGWTVNMAIYHFGRR